MSSEVVSSPMPRHPGDSETPAAVPLHQPRPAAPKKKDMRLAALYRFAFAITLFNVLGHLWFGFEQSWAQPLVSLATAYACELLFEWLTAWSENRRPRFLGGGVPGVFNFLLPAHITALAVAMLLYPNERFGPIMFAAGVAIGSKYVFRAKVGERVRHFFNPSNLGITATLLCFHWVSIAPPYMFTENMSGWGDWILPGIIVVSGSFLNARFTRRIPLILGWVGAFFLQALIRHLFLGSSLGGALMPMTGVAFLLFTFYMVSDPGTTPFAKKGQVAFGAAVAGVYGLMMALHIVFTIFFALTAVCILRGVSLWVQEWAAERAKAGEPAEALAGTAVSSQAVSSQAVSSPAVSSPAVPSPAVPSPAVSVQGGSAPGASHRTTVPGRTAEGVGS